MNKEPLEKYISSVLPLPPAKVQLLAEIFVFEELDKNQLLVQENRTPKETFFLETGVVRSYTFDSSGAEVTTDLYSAPTFCNDFLSFFKQQPAGENFQTLTPCRVWKSSYEQIQSHFHNVPEFREFGRLLLVTNYSRLHQRMLGLIKDTAEERYLKLMKQQPKIFQHVPLKHIASFLGITDSSLSRIRKDITHK